MACMSASEDTPIGGDCSLSWEIPTLRMNRNQNPSCHLPWVSGPGCLKESKCRDVSNGPWCPTTAYKTRKGSKVVSPSSLRFLKIFPVTSRHSV